MSLLATSARMRPFGHFVDQHDGGAFDPDHRVHEPALRARQSAAFHRIERLLVELDCISRAGTDQVRGDRVHIVRDGFHLGHDRFLLSDPGYFLPPACARWCWPCSLAWRVSAGPNPSGSSTCRISISPPWPGRYGQRLTHSMASSSEPTSHNQKPPTSSFVSGKGPSITVGFVPESDTRTPFETG